jgi:hypothetical protein
MTQRSTVHRHAALFGVAALTVAVACGDPYRHTNPYDPAVPVDVAVTGPDTLFSIGAIAQFGVVSTPAFPDTSVYWALDSAAHILLTAGDDSLVNAGFYIATGGSTGQFRVMSAPLEPATVTFTVTGGIGQIDTTVQYAIPGTDPVQNITVRTYWYRHSGAKNVILTQRLTQIRLRCPDPEAPACDTLSAGEKWSVWVDGFDALGHQIYALTSSTANPTTGPPVVTYIVRDTTVATSSPVGIRATTITALKSGTTWVVATRGALADSLQLVVR